ncbi:MAG: hypothetical protein M1819_003154 [Sarea resinae]|nr:MAG: hypothetical protein M1819_003154 [Sarea resinae]
MSTASTASGKKTRSILKTPSAKPAEISPQSPATLQRDRQIRETALYHANLIQQRKDVEAQILDATERLLDFPSFESADPARPSSNDTATFKNLLKPFQPSDYDSLIEERNIDGKCGYALCPRPPRKEGTEATYRIIRSKAAGFKVIEREKLEQWCSDDCARRGLYVKVQLSEEPAWLRAALSHADVVLLHETEDGRFKDRAVEDKIASSAERDVHLGLQDSQEGKLTIALQELALERGEPSTATSSNFQEIVVHENIPPGECLPPAAYGEGLHSAIEGYEPKDHASRHREQVAENFDKKDEDDESDTDWGL